ncbi:hypothetical protein WN55_07193 [Dufourea novaeangliae]|uniref:Uncharacterized protein n=1 Tax=Dufourea novaeangliae TaxID=178035 RepID=A0A154PS07_DUFNO|nr:hypothetical protein WN55_07193 [Dufourea novaeangliae]
MRTNEDLRLLIHGENSKTGERKNRMNSAHTEKRKKEGAVHPLACCINFELGNEEDIEFSTCMSCTPFRATLVNYASYLTPNTLTLPKTCRLHIFFTAVTKAIAFYREESTQNSQAIKQTRRRSRAGHYNLAASVARIDIKVNPICECTQGQEDLNHLIWQCCLYNSQRIDLINNLPSTPLNRILNQESKHTSLIRTYKKKTRKSSTSKEDMKAALTELLLASVPLNKQ